MAQLIEMDLTQANNLEKEKNIYSNKTIFDLCSLVIYLSTTNFSFETREYM